MRPGEVNTTPDVVAAADGVGHLVHADVFARRPLGDPLAIRGPLMTMLAHDQGMPQLVGMEGERPALRRRDVRAIVGWNLGSYRGIAARDPLIRDYDDAGGVWLDLPYVLLTDVGVDA